MAGSSFSNLRRIVGATRRLFSRVLRVSRTFHFCLITGILVCVVGVLSTSQEILVVSLATTLWAFGFMTGLGREISRNPRLLMGAIDFLRLGSAPGITKFENVSRRIKVAHELAWEGFRSKATADLEEIANDPQCSVLERHAAILALVNWEFANGLIEQANNRLEDMGAIPRLSELLRDFESLSWEIRSLAPNASRPAGASRSNRYDLNIGYFWSNFNGLENRFDHMNRFFRQNGFAPVRPTNFSLEGLLCHPRRKVCRYPVKVSVIIPVRNCAKTIENSINSILHQTWRTLEVIVVDDASTDATVDVLRSLADDRIVVVENEETVGEYVSRNNGLKVATGEFVTVHGANAWCHPERIQTQTEHLLQNPTVTANATDDVRVTDDLKFMRRGLERSDVVGLNSSSLMMRAQELRDLGGWDLVREAADSELFERLNATAGNRVVERLHPTVPLTLALNCSETSGRSRDTGMHSLRMQTGVRNLYSSAYRIWHQSEAFATSPALSRTSDFAPFPAPALLLDDEGSTKFDVGIMSSFNLMGGTTSSNCTEILANERLGLSTALIHNRSLSHRAESINPVVYERCSDRTRLVATGESVNCDVLIIKYPPCVASVPDAFPKVEVRGEILIAVNQTPRTGYDHESQIVYSITECNREVVRVFGKEPIWAPISPAVRFALEEHHSEELEGVRFSTVDWVELIDLDEWMRPIKIPNPNQLRIGRHGRDSVWKWPSDKNSILAAYPSSPNFEIDILGGATSALEVLGYLPPNWTIREFGSAQPSRYLADLDFFVYFPHPHMVEGFGRTVLEALAVGVPVITDERFKPLFGEAVISCMPREVETVISSLASDPDQYSRQVKLGLDLVRSHYGIDAHEARLAALRSL